ncbi:MAG TPA: TraR/DksA family transcriptional regulator [Chthoniobacterales bacterium]
MDIDDRNPQNPPAEPPTQTDLILGRPADLAPKDVVAAVADEQLDPEMRSRYQQLLQLRDYVTDMENDLQTQGEEVQPTDRRQANADSATSVNLRDMALVRAGTYTELIEEIDAALGRIEGGTYGKCELTGKAIPADRLDAIPWTRYTAEAEEQLEKEGKAPAQFKFPESGRVRGSSGAYALGDDPQATVEEGPASPS